MHAKYSDCFMFWNHVLSLCFLQEWKAHGYMHPPLKFKVETTSGSTQFYDLQNADFGADFRHTPGMTFNAELVISDPFDGCKPLKTHDYTDKLVLIQAHSNDCEFCKKVVYAQIAKAKGVLIEGIDEHITYLPPQSCGQYVSIPTVMIKRSSGDLLRTEGYRNAHITFPVCPEWNGIAPGFGMEQCDDNNTAHGDGCSELCLWECGNAVVVPPEECDDQNRINGDGCSARCLVERFEPPTEPRNPQVIASGVERFSIAWQPPAEGKPTGG
jgi:cysteine-rich repeat protein